MTERPLSPAQQAILDAMAAGAELRFRIYRGSWRYLLIACPERSRGGAPVDGRTVSSLLWRELVTWSNLYGDDLELTPRGRERAAP